jgi:ribosomal-protein-alanine N-acetyltransferase
MGIEKVTLEPLNESHTEMIQRYAADIRVASTCNIQHPIPLNYGSEVLKKDIKGRLTRTRYTFAVFYNNEFAGMGSLSKVDHSTGTAEISYWIAFSFWGKGIATEAVTQIVEFAWYQLKLKRLTTGVLVRNPASQRVLVKNGFICIGNETIKDEYGEKLNGEFICQMECNKIPQNALAPGVSDYFYESVKTKEGTTNLTCHSLRFYMSPHF